MTVTALSKNVAEPSSRSGAAGRSSGERAARLPFVEHAGASSETVAAVPTTNRLSETSDRTKQRLPVNLDVMANWMKRVKPVELLLVVQTGA